MSFFSSCEEQGNLYEPIPCAYIYQTQKINAINIIWRVLIFINRLCKEQYQKYMIYSSMYVLLLHYTVCYNFSSKIPHEIKVHVRYSDAEIKDKMLIDHCTNTE